MKLVGAGAVLLAGLAQANVYFHSPRGSNNRLNERSAAVRNRNRVFHSNNNDRGGYNVGDKTDAAAQEEHQQFAMKYFMSGDVGKSKLTLEWTNQMGCGVDEDGDKINDCSFLIQTLCQEDTTDATTGKVPRENGWVIRNGKNNNQNGYEANGDFAESQAQKNERRQGSQEKNRGLHESFEFYDRCDGSDDDRYGLECKDERQQFSYDKITPWNDVVYLTDDLSQCSTFDVANSNARQFWECVEYYDAARTKRKHRSQHLEENACTLAGGDWLGFYKVGDILTDVDNAAGCTGDNQVWGRPMNWEDLANDVLTPEACIALPPRTDCVAAPNTRGNYLGNVDGGHTTPRYIWTLPKYLTEKRCVMRIRYFVANRDPEQINFDNNLIEMGGDMLRLAVPEFDTVNNRVVFEDRSHVFHLVPRTPEIADDLDIENVVVRGKRGNIVQTYPAVEYDFVPARLEITAGTAVHLQWAGSNSHNNGHPAGDGQAGDAGEGRGGTDRHNFIPMLEPKVNFPMPHHNHTIFHDAEWVWSSHNKGAPENKALNLAMSLATAGYFHCKEETECGASAVNAKRAIQERMDNAAASYSGNIFVPPVGEFYYKCLRNDNFSNRSQKGRIRVLQQSQAPAAATQTLRKKRSVKTSAGRNC